LSLIFVLGAVFHLLIYADLLTGEESVLIETESTG